MLQSLRDGSPLKKNAPLPVPTMTTVPPPEVLLMVCLTRQQLS
jgi:hypothetical protein